MCKSKRLPLSLTLQSTVFFASNAKVACLQTYRLFFGRLGTRYTRYKPILLGTGYTHGHWCIAGTSVFSKALVIAISLCVLYALHRLHPGTRYDRYSEGCAIQMRSFQNWPVVPKTAETSNNLSCKMLVNSTSYKNDIDRTILFNVGWEDKEISRAKLNQWHIIRGNRIREYWRNAFKAVSEIACTRRINAPWSRSRTSRYHSVARRGTRRSIYTSAIWYRVVEISFHATRFWEVKTVLWLIDWLINIP